MSALLNNSTGNLTTAATWSLIDSTSFLNSEAASSNSTTSFVSSQNFTPGAITIDGIAVKVQSVSATNTGTFSVRLFNSTGAVAVTGTTVTINVSDLNSVNAQGWVFMKFASSVTLLAATAYNVQISSSTTNRVSLYRSGTAGDWSRALRTTTTQAPVAGDNMLVCGDFTGAGTGNSYTVTNNNTATTIFGYIDISTKGSLISGSSASTNYYLKLNGNLTCYDNSNYKMGTSGTPIPSTSTSKLEFNVASNVQYGIDLRAGANCETYGNAITQSAKLAANASVSATSLTTNVSTGWKNGDNIAIASTTQTASDCESKLLTADASGTTLTIAALSAAHSGSSPTQAELINLTRNVAIFGTSASLQTSIGCNASATVSFNNTEFYWMGSATTGNRGIDIGTITGSFTMNGCSAHNFEVTSSRIFLSTANNNNITISNNNFYLIATGIFVTAGTNTGRSITGNIFIKNTSGILYDINDLNITLSNNTAVGATTIGFSLTDASTSPTAGTVSGLTAHSNTTIGIQLTGVISSNNNPTFTVSSSVVWRNLTYGFEVRGCDNFIIDTMTAFGNATANVDINVTVSSGIIFKSLTVDAGSTFVSPIGLFLGVDCQDIVVQSSKFGNTTTHATGDISIASGVYPTVKFQNCLFASTNEFSGVTTNMVDGGLLSSAKHDQTAGNHKQFKTYGTISSDTVIYNFESPSSRMTPNSSAQKLKSGLMKFAVPNGKTATVGIYVRKSVVGDGSAYNGNQVRLILKSDASVGVASDTVLVSSTNAANGAWQLISATTAAINDDAAYTVFLDCDGTAGWVNLDNFRVEIN